MRALTSTIATLLPVLLLAGPVSAGYYLEHQTIMPDPVTKEMKTHTVRSWHEGKRFKRENPMRNETVIIDLESNTVYGLNKTNKTFWKVTPEKYKQLAIVTLLVMGVQVTPQGGIMVPENMLTPTGKVMTIEGKEAYEVKVNNTSLPQAQGMTMETSFWLSRDVKIPIEKMIDELRIALNNPKGEQYKRLFNQWRDLDGYPVQSVTTVKTPQGTMVTKETLKTYKRKKIPATEFTVPKGYTKTVDPITQLEQMGKQLQQRMKQQQREAAGNTGAPGGKKRVLPAGKKPTK